MMVNGKSLHEEQTRPQPLTPVSPVDPVELFEEVDDDGDDVFGRDEIEFELAYEVTDEDGAGDVLLPDPREQLETPAVELQSINVLMIPTAPAGTDEEEADPECFQIEFLGGNNVLVTEYNPDGSVVSAVGYTLPEDHMGEDAILAQLTMIKP